MGNKVNPIAFRLGYNMFWNNVHMLKHDTLFFNKQIKSILTNTLIKNSILPGRCIIHNAPNHTNVYMHYYVPTDLFYKKPNLLILKDKSFLKDNNVTITFIQVHNLMDDAIIFANYIANAIQLRKNFLSKIDPANDNIRITLSGRLFDAEMAQKKVIKHGKIPLNKISANISHGTAQALTKYGIIGVKVTIFLS